MPESKLAEKLGFRVEEGYICGRAATPSELLALWNLCLELSERLATAEDKLANVLDGHFAESEVIAERFRIERTDPGTTEWRTWSLSRQSWDYKRTVKSLTRLAKAYPKSQWRIVPELAADPERKDAIKEIEWHRGEYQKFIDELQAALTQAQQERDERMRVLESFTPSGSEFVNDVKRCKEFIRERLDKSAEIARNAVIARKAVEAQKSALMEALEPFAKNHNYRANVTHDQWEELSRVYEQVKGGSELLPSPPREEAP